MKTILIDLDGVLNEYTGGYNPKFIPPMRIGVPDLLKNLSLKYDVKIFTTRNYNLTKEWLISNDIYKYVNGITNEKISAYLIIDDRCVNFDGNYDKLKERIEKFKPWYKK